jgi:ABC-type branched-subunit amino acid transport system ATPase component
MAEIKAQDITAGYDGPPILDKVSVTAETGRVTVVLGPNGAGKSTLAKAIVGLIPVRNGRVTIDGVDVTGQKPHELVKKGLAYLPQLRNVFDDMSIIENLEMGGYTKSRQMRKKVNELLAMFPDLAKDRHKHAKKLSGGQQRMLALARMLMTDPSVAILDEPTAGLSPLYTSRVWDQIVQIKQAGVGLLVIEQNAAMAMERADSVYLLAQGQNVLSGEANAVRSRPEVARILVG